MTEVLRGGTVVTPAGSRVADVVIADGRIVAVTPPGEGDGAVAMDATGLLVLPGMIDAHVHFQEPGREDWEGFATGSAAAASGGVTTVVDMPIDCDPPTTTARDVRAKATAAQRHSLVDVAIWGGLTPTSLGALGEMADAGVAGFKAFACPSGWDEFPPVDTAALAAGLRFAATRDLPVAVHCELGGHEVAHEVAAVAWAARLAAETGGRLHVVHVSSPEAIAEARRWPGVTTETCPHYLLLDDRAAAAKGAAACCFPPIRDEARRHGLWSDATDGRIDLIASDHSPCPPDRRATWAGIDSVGLALPLLLDAGFPVTRLVAMATSAARLLRLPGKGSVAPGFDADLAVVDPNERWTVEERTHPTRYHLSPYLGRQIIGRVVQTRVRGRVTFTTDVGPASCGYARVLRPATNSG